ncbi:glutamine synthetase-like [Oppia nitens]|uniref:glutamine synthetase-like n=1 Tax=Oppia nitens TaxID=1686743 RepID=UPI0023DC9D6D|nr:glutamine synthetase-like [Oppia nitens]
MNISVSTSLKSNQTYLAKYLSLEQPKDAVQITYVFQHPGVPDSNGNYQSHWCGKTKVVDFVPRDASELPIWNSGVPDVSTTEIYLKPVRLYNDPFRRGNNKLVLCETYTDEMKPLITNFRYSCNEAMNEAKDEYPWFGIEQEFYLLDGTDGRPLGWPKTGYPKDIHDHQVLYHSAVGANNVYGRDVIEAHFRACLYAGIKISGENAEAMPSQWEYQVGPCEGIRIGDDLMMSRFILYRVAEDLHIGVTFDPKPVPGWLGAGAHTNFSTAAMRAEGGIKEIERALEKLSKTHAKHMTKYDPHGGADNQRRLIGADFAPKLDEFRYGVADRSASARIPKQVAQDGCGYFEDRRPASNCDPYQVTEALVRTVCLNGKEWEGKLYRYV